MSKLVNGMLKPRGYWATARFFGHTLKHTFRPKCDQSMPIQPK